MPLDGISLPAIIAIVLAVALGGVLKGATGAGAPIIAVPLIASLADVRLAVLVMIVPNLFANLWQTTRYYHARPAGPLPWVFALTGCVGAVLGTVLLVRLDERWLMLGVALAVLAYVALRTVIPDLRLSPRLAQRLAAPVGLVGGILQGAAGFSSPVSVSFLNAVRLERPAFIATISIFFATITIVQIASLTAGGLIHLDTLLLSLAACAPLLMAMPIGTWIARRMSPQQFDRLVLGMLVILAARLLWSALT